MWYAADRGRISTRLLVAGVAAAMLPDLAVAAFALGIPYADSFGDRGASHSILFAILIALLGIVACKALRAPPSQAAAWPFVCAISHPLLDAATSGGLGVALPWPWSEQRLFAPWRPILVSPFANGFFSARGMSALLSELRWVWLPLFVGATLWKLIQRLEPRADVPWKCPAGAPHGRELFSQCHEELARMGRSYRKCW